MIDKNLLDYLMAYLTDNRKQLFDKVLSERTRHFTVVTEDVYQLHNTSAVMRSCDVFGIQDLHVVEEIEGKRIDKEIAMGAQKWVTLKRYHTIDTCIDTLKKEGYRIIATTPHQSSVSLQSFNVTQKAAFFFGKESYGLSEKVLNKADGFLKIPMYGFTESLNISVAVAIVLQQLVEKLKQSSNAWQLSEEEINEVKMQWTTKSIKSAEAIIAHYYTNNS